jgi:hypothetical protein
MTKQSTIYEILHHLKLNYSKYDSNIFRVHTKNIYKLELDGYYYQSHFFVEKLEIEMLNAVTNNNLFSVDSLLEFVQTLKDDDFDILIEKIKKLRAFI